MIVYRSLEEVQYQKKSVVTIGMFDGVHLAHQTIIRQAIEKSRRMNGRNVVVTFEPHPQEVVSKGTKNVVLLSTLEDKLQRIEKLGVDVVFIIPFTYNFSQLTFQEFYSKYIIIGVGVSEVVEGFNHHFGRDREGDMNQVRELGKEYGFSVETLAMMNKQEIVIASSVIRESLLLGDVILANTLLGYEYNFTGTVVKGYGRGKQLGYPTANIVITDKKKLVPRIGIYAVQIEVEGKWYKGMMSIGHNPTFGDAHIRTIEVNIFDFDKDIYDETVTVRSIQRTRDEKKFNSVDELIKELGNDKLTIKNILDHYKQISS